MKNYATLNQPSRYFAARLITKGTKFTSLADYCAMGNSEVSMKEGATVELKKIGCAGWWYVRVLGK